jgi:hypothetical protein
MTREEFLEGMKDHDSISQLSEMGKEMDSIADDIEEHDPMLARHLRGIFTAMEATAQYIKAQYP